MGGLILFAVAVFVYFLPTIIGGNEKNIGAIFVLNLFLGWTLVGWVVALVWALTHENSNIEIVSSDLPPTHQQINKADKFDKLEQIKKLHDDGVLTKEQYEEAKSKILS